MGGPPNRTRQIRLFVDAYSAVPCYQEGRIKWAPGVQPRAVNEAIHSSEDGSRQVESRMTLPPGFVAAICRRAEKGSRDQGPEQRQHHRPHGRLGVYAAEKVEPGPTRQQTEQQPEPNRLLRLSSEVPPRGPLAFRHDVIQAEPTSSGMATPHRALPLDRVIVRLRLGCIRANRVPPNWVRHERRLVVLVSGWPRVVSVL